MEQIYLKRYFQFKWENLKVAVKFSIFQLVYVPNFILSRQFVWNIFSRKECCRYKASGMNIIIELSIFALVQSPSFILNRQFLFYGPNCTKIVFSVNKRKSEHLHRIQQNWISLVAKFYVKKAFFIFFNNFFQKG